jgi:uncharacterized protein
MSLTMYEVSVPALKRGLSSLSGLIDKADAHVREKGLAPAALLDARLADDMFPFVRQVQIASDSAKGTGARLVGLTPPSFEDTEASFPELKARIAKTLAFLDTLTPAQFDGSESRTIEMAMRQGTLTFDGKSFLLGFALPNFYFHVTTAYDILRHQGVALGKRDYLGGL